MIKQKEANEKRETFNLVSNPIDAALNSSYRIREGGFQINLDFLARCTNFPLH